MRFRGTHTVRHTHAIESKTQFLGINTSDIVIVSTVSFILSQSLKGYSIEVLYLALGVTSTTLFTLFFLKNKYLPRGALVFILRKLFISKKRLIEPPEDIPKRSIHE
jgi:low affinity Fe/Cu permease